LFENLLINIFFIIQWNVHHMFPEIDYKYKN